MFDINNILDGITDPGHVAESDQIKTEAHHRSAELMADIAVMLAGKHSGNALELFSGVVSFGQRIHGMTEGQLRAVVSVQALQLLQMVVTRCGGIPEFVHRVRTGQQMPCLNCDKDPCPGSELADLEGLFNA
jgi:hypothetical protein